MYISQKIDVMWTVLEKLIDKLILVQGGGGLVPSDQFILQQFVNKRTDFDDQRNWRFTHYTFPHIWGESGYFWGNNTNHQPITFQIFYNNVSNIFVINLNGNVYDANTLEQIDNILNEEIAQPQIPNFYKRHYRNSGQRHMYGWGLHQINKESINNKVDCKKHGIAFSKTWDAQGYGMPIPGNENENIQFIFYIRETSHLLFQLKIRVFDLNSRTLSGSNNQIHQNKTLSEIEHILNNVFGVQENEPYFGPKSSKFVDDSSDSDDYAVSPRGESTGRGGSTPYGAVSPRSPL